MKPSLEEFSKLCIKGETVLLYKEIDGDMETPISLYEKLCGQGKGYLLESGDRILNGALDGRYSFIGYDLDEIKSYSTEEDVMDKVKQELKKSKPLNELKEFPFYGGYVGYFGYDTIKCYENIPNENENDLNMPIMHMLMAKNLVVYDHLELKITIIIRYEVKGLSSYMVEYDMAKEAIDEIIEKIGNTRINTSRQSLGESSKPVSNFTKEEYMANVVKAKEYIKAGDIFQVVLSQRFEVDTTMNPFDVYRRLRRINPSPYMYYMNLGEATIVGSSPEMIVKVTGDKVENCPIAGTRPRGKDITEDNALEEELLADEKELAEHLMLVDLGRNDLGKICDFGTVKAKNMMHIEKYSSVMHIVTNLEGRLKKENSCFDALKSCIPAGTLSGAPKIRAMEIIDELENKNRGIYAGAIGYIGYDGNMDTCITIRTILFKGQKAYLQAGAGIVYDSVPEKEYEETLNKLKALMRSIE